MVEIRIINSSCRLALLWLSKFVKMHPCTSRREAEKQGTAYLLKELFPNETALLQYQPNGKPYLLNTKGGISISHSHDLLAVLHDEQHEHTGLDVEQIRDKVLKIRHKFLSANEQLFIAEDHVSMHIKAWCAKETMFKIHAAGKVDFIQHLHIDAFTDADEFVNIRCTAAETAFSKKLRIEKLDDYIISYPVN